MADLIFKEVKKILEKRFGKEKLNSFSEEFLELFIIHTISNMLSDLEDSCKEWDDDTLEQEYKIWKEGNKWQEI